MAKFDEAFKITGHNEGGYANNPNDHGGETYAGIARKFWPNWGGWQYIDKIKLQFHTAKDIDRAISVSGAPIHLLVADFYKQNFWDANKLDAINDQQIANNVYDFGVNSGTKRGAKTLQQAVGVVDDGIIGNSTLAAVNGGNTVEIYNKYNQIRSDFYHALVAKSPDQHQFLNSWMSRIKPYKTV